MARINCENRNNRRAVDLSKIRRTAALVLRGLRAAGAEVNIVLVSDRRIRALNRRYLGVDGPTDVIAFREGPGRSLTRAGESRFLGDIAISSDTAARNARIYGVPFTKEITLLVIHGVLHLLGMEDVSAGGRRRMRKKEDEFLQKAKSFS